jgi:uncharacterized protein YodC (DUF2158 family)
MEKNFKTGDVVRLNSGGHKMTVEGYKPKITNLIPYEDEESTIVICRYEKENGEIAKPYFEQDMLSLVND